MVNHGSHLTGHSNLRPGCIPEYGPPILGVLGGDAMSEIVMRL